MKRVAVLATLLALGAFSGCFRLYFWAERYDVRTPERAEPTPTPNWT